MLSNIFDTHAHFEDALFNDTRFEVLDKLQANGVVNVLNCCSDVEVIPTILELLDKYDFLYGSAGVHPHWTPETPDNYLDILRDALKHPKMVALGEIGLDYFWPDDKQVQMRMFVEQMELAKELDLPVIIHDRDAHDDVYPVLEKYRLPGIVHRFAGDLNHLKKVLDMGMYISFNGDITYPEWNETLLKVIAAVPNDAFLLETDAPYMPPKVLEDQKICDPTMIPHIVQVIADIKKMDPQEVCDITYKNALRAYRLEK